MYARKHYTVSVTISLAKPKLKSLNELGTYAFFAKRGAAYITSSSYIPAQSGITIDNMIIEATMKSDIIILAVH